MVIKTRPDYFNCRTKPNKRKHINTWNQDSAVSVITTTEKNWYIFLGQTYN